MNGARADWTEGEPRIVYQHCASCRRTWYFRRSFCPHCGAVDPEVRGALGTGTVYAVSLVHRAPTPEWRTHTPYLIVLIDIDEGFRMMAHGAHELEIGDRVEASFERLADRLVPFFKKVSP